jgi:hypothetical protein
LQRILNGLVECAVTLVGVFFDNRLVDRRVLADLLVDDIDEVDARNYRLPIVADSSAPL